MNLLKHAALLKQACRARQAQSALPKVFSVNMLEHLPVVTTTTAGFRGQNREGGEWLRWIVSGAQHTTF